VIELQRRRVFAHRANHIFFDAFPDANLDFEGLQPQRHPGRTAKWATLRFEAGFAQFQKVPEIKDFADLAHLA